MSGLQSTNARKAGPPRTEALASLRLACAIAGWVCFALAVAATVFGARVDRGSGPALDAVRGEEAVR